MTCQSLCTSAGFIDIVKESLMWTSVTAHGFGLLFASHVQKELTLEETLIQMVAAFCKTPLANLPSNGWLGF